MTVTPSPQQENPPDTHSWRAEVLKLIDRTLGSRVRFRRLLGLVAALAAIALVLALVLHAIPLTGVLAGLLLRR